MLTVVNLPAVVLRRIVRPTARDPFRAGHLVVAAVAAAAGLTVVVVVSPHRLGPALGVLALVAGALVGAVATRVPRRLGEERRVEERFFGTLGRPRATGPFRVLQRAIADVPTWAVIATGCVLALGSRRTGPDVGTCLAACAAGLVAAETLLGLAARSAARPPRTGAPRGPLRPHTEPAGVVGGRS